MRVKKQKRHRKVVRFYSACFGFREPYKVLLDGTLVHHLLSNDLSPADHALSRVLGGRCLLFTTKCILAEIRSLGPSHTETLDAAKQLMIARCDHEKRVSGTSCIHSVIGEKNSEHFFVGTQDPDLRKKFREVPGVPVIYGLKNSLLLEQPSFSQREFAKLAEERRLHMTETEVQNFFKATSRENLPEGDSDENQEERTRTILHSKKRSLGVVDKPQFKRKMAKGPNPLSCKKKKPKEETSAAQNQNKDGKEEPVAKRKRSRKRKRSSGDGNSKSETES